MVSELLHAFGINFRFRFKLFKEVDQTKTYSRQG